MAQLQHVKGLPKIKKSVNHFLQSVKYLSAWNNLESNPAKTVKLFTVFLLRLYNVRFSDLPITEFKPLGKRSERLYILILLSLSFMGKYSRSRVLGLCNITPGSGMPLIEQLLAGGYIKTTPTKRSHLIQGRNITREVDEIELTVKGYRLVDYILSLLLDDRIINWGFTPAAGCLSRFVYPLPIKVAQIALFGSTTRFP